MSNARPQRVTLAQIAALAHLSPATVSLALRHDPRISAQTAEIVFAAARQLGYVPDPLLTKLMSHLRSRRPASTRANLCAIAPPLPPCDPYYQPLLQALRTRASRLGYHLGVEPLSLDPERAKLQERALLQRNIQGLIFLPSRRQYCLDGLLDWSRFALVASGFTPLSPDIDRVVLNAIGATRSLLAALSARGFRRVAFVLDAQFDFLLRHQISSTLHNARHTGSRLHLKLFHFLMPGAEKPYECMPPSYAGFLENGNQIQRGEAKHLRDALADWLRHQRNDVLVFDTESSLNFFNGLLREGPRGRHLPVLCCLRSPGSAYAGYTMDPVQLGGMAIDLLHQKVLSGVWGLPHNASVQLIQGNWGEPGT